MPLMTQLHDRGGKLRSIPWSWEDRMILAEYVLLDGGTVGDAKAPEDWGLLNMGYIGAGCDHTFANTFGYCQVDTKKAIWVRPGQRYHEYRS